MTGGTHTTSIDMVEQTLDGNQRTMTDTGHLKARRFVVVDVEGNGRQPPELVELAIVAITIGEGKTTIFEWLVRPQESITAEVISIHGISNEMVANAPRFEEVAPEVQAALSDDYFIAHHARTELEILLPRLPGWKPKGVIDTLQLARAYMPGQESYSLSALAEALCIARPVGIPGPHRALYDALVTREVFLKLALDATGEVRPISQLLSAPMEGSGSMGTQGILF